VSPEELFAALVESDTDVVVDRELNIPESDAGFRTRFLDLLVGYHLDRDRRGREAGGDLHVDAAQALFEPIQNAIAVGAKAIDMGFVGRGKNRMFIFAHDGSPFRAVDAFALVVPHESAKRGEAELEGQFGTGVTSLTRWGGRLLVDDVHYAF